jgi:hypothetical protein
MDLEIYTKAIRVLTSDKFHKDAYQDSKIWRGSFLESLWRKKLFDKKIHPKKAAQILERAYYRYSFWTTSEDYIDRTNTYKQL